jgi:histidine ammonia-lyase
VDFFQKALGVGAFLPDYTNLPTMMVRGERLSDGYSEIGIAVASSW